MPTTPLELVSLFPSLLQLKKAVQDWSIVDKFAFHMYLKDKDRANYRCKPSKPHPARELENAIVCNWRVFTSQTRTGDIKLATRSQNTILLEQKFHFAQPAIPSPGLCNRFLSTWLVHKRLHLENLLTQFNFIIMKRSATRLDIEHLQNSATIHLSMGNSYRQLLAYLAHIQKANS